MGHRALVAYERTDGQYTLHYSHWGAANLKLKHCISAESPFGGEDTDSTWAKQLLAELAGGLEADAVDGYLIDENRPSTVVEPKPRATGHTLNEIVADRLDYLHHEAFFVVSPTTSLRAANCPWRWPSPTGSPSYQRTVASAPFPTVSPCSTVSESYCSPNHSVR